MIFGSGVPLASHLISAVSPSALLLISGSTVKNGAAVEYCKVRRRLNVAPWGNSHINLLHLISIFLTDFKKKEGISQVVCIIFYHVVCMLLVISVNCKLIATYPVSNT